MAFLNMVGILQTLHLLVASETRAFVFSGQKNKALVTLINDHDILANLAYDPKDGGAQVVSISPSSRV
jgi:hypothetical protein